MCGICGFSTVNETVLASRQEIIRKMCGSLSHRGPDEEGYFLSNNIALGMRRLSIIGRFNGSQPIYSEDQTKCIIADGEVYNFKELRVDIEKRGHRFSTSSDIEVILHLYEDYGYETLNFLNGMFAFCIYDKKDDSLFIARDRLGVKPLHYYFTDSDFVFASEIKAILKFPPIARNMDFDSLNQYLTYEYIPAPKTIYRDIYKLQQGHYLTFKNRRIKITQYWNTGFKNKVNYSLGECQERLTGLIESSVGLRLNSEVPLGGFLSGGIDSSLICAFACRNSSTPFNTFNISFDEKSFDESAFARLAAKFLGTRHFEERFTSQQALDLLPKIIAILDEPLADASVLPSYLLSHFAKKNITVALTGDGGDELFAGYPTYLAQKIADRLPKFSYPAINFLANSLAVNDDDISLDFKLKKFASGLKFPPGVRNQIWLGAFTPEEKEKLLMPDVYQRIYPKSEFDILDYYQLRCDAINPDDKILYQDLQLYLQDNMLVKMDRLSLANSLEARSPFLDYRVVEFAASLPFNFKLKSFTSKYILRKIAKGLIPDEIIKRPKKGFGIPVAKWLKSELKGLMLDLLSPEKIKREGFFNQVYVSKIISDHLSNKRDNRKLLWALLIFELWLNENKLTI